MSRVYALLVGILLTLPVSAKEHREVATPTVEEVQQLLSSVQDLVEYYYVDSVDRQKMVEGALKGMLTSLDPHSTYLSEQTLELLREANRGHYYGYGIEVSVEEGQIQVITPLAHSSAALAGVMPGDILMQVDHIVATPESLDELIHYIKASSQDDKALQVTLSRNSTDDPVIVMLEPSNITIDSAQFFELGNQVAYVQITSFNRQTATQVAQFARQMKALGNQQLVLDLRNNPGGLFDSAVQIADMFLSSGLIVSTHGRFLDANSDYYASDSMLFDNIEVVILINEGSASAAEILAGALKDHDRATLMGQQSFGKGTVQSLIPLLSEQGAIKLTTARYATPSGEFINKVGITPDINVLVEKSTKPHIMTAQQAKENWQKDSQLYAAYDWLLQDRD
ncbi:S41 family peptidase [Ferrimonas aestuarii]|uniref:S41 family peptidase n=1 Tax=Ferrimonas aestuarii TaxID=2569539 RepID=A0A4U1BMY6_9GAMM|nr:S41 family peptidase [Ferrimonas aestuarii]TKB55043.1 S41 family peptidase [Ferrimonas aestuarii]